jgi:hypothetical protein
MAGSGAVGEVVASPTYMANIRFFFRPVDIEHMRAKGIELGNYEGVRTNAFAIYAHTAPPNADMPPEPKAQWSAEQSQTFKNWIINGCPLGSAVTQAAVAAAAPAATGRVRKNVASLSAAEIETLRTAFEGLMSRAPSDPNSYFALAGQHWLPHRWCAHHIDPFNPWHRVYINEFEEQLRSIKGCEGVTLPYWDIATPLPELLQKPPFASYVLPEDPGKDAKPPEPGYFPYTTQRYPLAKIAQSLKENEVLEDIETSLKQSLWGSFVSGGYQKFSMQAHDGGHDSIGPTMGDQNVAAYDPVFWFFHCNIDRLWLKWQTAVGATTLSGFETTLQGNTGWLRAPFNTMKPFSTTADETIAFGISYDDLGAVGGEEITMENKVGSVDAAHSFTIARSAPVSVRVKGIERLNIPGTFAVKLLADGEQIARRAFFQPKSPRDCATCSENALIDLDFRIDQEKLLDRRLSIEIEVPGQEEIGASFPLSQAGNPTINVRLLLDDE